MAQKKDTCAAFIDILREKFKNRGIAEKIHTDEEKSRKRTDRTKKKYSSDEVAKKSKKYRSGVHNGMAVTTSDDFAKYYKDLRNARLPRAKQRDEQEYIDAKNETHKGTPLQTKKERRLAIVKLLRIKARSWGLLPPNPKRFFEESNNGFDEDLPQNRGVARQGRIPKNIFLVIAVLFISLLLVVTSSVMVSRIESDVAHLEARLEDLEAQKTKVESELTVKNDMVKITEIAENDYNMIKSGYQQSRYIDIDRSDKIEMSGKKGNASALIRLFEALGLVGE